MGETHTFFSGGGGGIRCISISIAPSPLRRRRAWDLRKEHNALKRNAYTVRSIFHMLLHTKRLLYSDFQPVLLCLFSAPYFTFILFSYFFQARRAAPATTSSPTHSNMILRRILLAALLVSGVSTLQSVHVQSVPQQ